MSSKLFDIVKKHGKSGTDRYLVNSENPIDRSCQFSTRMSRENSLLFSLLAGNLVGCHLWLKSSKHWRVR